MIELFKRLDIVKAYIGKTRIDLASALDLEPGVMNAQFKRNSTKIFLSLPRLFELIPNLNAEWLYLGKGEPIKKESSGDCLALRQQVQELTETNRRLAETNQRLVEELLARK